MSVVRGAWRAVRGAWRAPRVCPNRRVVGGRAPRTGGGRLTQALARAAAKRWRLGEETDQFSRMHTSIRGPVRPSAEAG